MIRLILVFDIAEYEKKAFNQISLQVKIGSIAIYNQSPVSTAKYSRAISSCYVVSELGC